MTIMKENVNGLWLALRLYQTRLGGPKWMVGPQLTEQEHVSVTTSATPSPPPHSKYTISVTHRTHAHEGERGKGLLLG